jgi:hypothetical protein
MNYFVGRGGCNCRVVTNINFPSSEPEIILKVPFGGDEVVMGPGEKRFIFKLIREDLEVFGFVSQGCGVLSIRQHGLIVYRVLSFLFVV